MSKCKHCQKDFEDKSVRKKRKYCSEKCLQQETNAKARAKTASKTPPKIGNCCLQCGGDKETRQSHYCRPCKKIRKKEWVRNWKIKKGLPVLTDEKIKARKEKEPKIIKEKEEKKARILTKELKQTTSKIIKEKRLKRLNAGVIEDGRDLQAVEDYDNNYRSRDKDRGIIQRELTNKEKNLIDEFLKQRGQAVYINAKSEMLGLL